MTDRMGPSTPGADTPPGLQRERTLLAWTRTQLALVVSAALLVRVVGPPLLRPVHLPAAVVLGIVLWSVAAADLRYRRGASGGRVVFPRRLLAVAVAATLVGVSALVALGTA